MENGFPPIADKQAKIIILGSMPSVKSLEQQQYYAHPRNAFWPVMAAIVGFDKNESYQTRCQLLIDHHIAVWDALKACERHGSLDQNIEPPSMVANDFTLFFQQHPNIKHIYFNGGKAEQVFKQYALPKLSEPFKSLDQTRLPSTSPAHAAMKFEQKLGIWKDNLT